MFFDGDQTMKRFARLAVWVAMFTAGLTSATHAQSLTTTAPNNGSGGVFLDLTPVGGALNLNAFASYFSSTAGTPVSVEVWTRPGSYVGFSGSNAGWTLTQTVVGTSAGTATLSASIPLTTPIPLPAAATTGICLHVITTGGGIRYTGTTTVPPQTTWSNADITLFSDIARTGTVAFAGTANTPRCFAGAIEYTTADPNAVGACCFNNGTCQDITLANCQTGGGVFRGGSSACSTITCPQPGSCCALDGTCTVVLQSGCTGGGTWGGANTTCAAPCPLGACCLANTTCSLAYRTACTAQSGLHFGDNSACPAGPCIVEIEPNSSKAEATPITLGSGQTLRGLTSGTVTTAGSTLDTTVDYIRLKTPPAAAGIYRHAITLDSPAAGHSTWIRGLTQTAATAGPWPGPVGTATATESAGQTNFLSGTGRVNIWYGFGREEEVYYRIAGAATTTSPYAATLETTPITPTSLGTLAAGLITITTTGQGHTNDTAIRVYDSNFNPIPGHANDSASTNGGAPANTTTTSFLRREYAAGTYYFGLTIGDLSTNQGSPCDDNARTGVMLDFPNVAANVGTLTTTDVSFSIDDGTGAIPFTAARGGTREIAWFTFTAAGAVPTGACCFPDGSCTVLANGACIGNPGAVYQGDATACATANCPQPGACCFPNGSCTFVLQTACSGTWTSVGTTCTLANCPQPPLGACCATDSTCAQANVYTCSAANGSWLGAGTSCTGVVCPTVIISNFPPTNDTGTSAALTTLRVKALGFIMPAGNAYSLTQVDMRLNCAAATVVPDVRIYSDSGTGPGTELAQLVEPPVTVTGVQTFTAAPGSSFTLQPATKYWLVVLADASSVGTLDWRGSSPAITPTGLATHEGSLFGTAGIAGAFATSATINTYAIKGLSVPGGVCCRGSTCNASVAQANCTGSGTAGAFFATPAASCNAGGSVTTPCCYANYNKANGITVQDIFDFLSDWFANSPLAKVGGDGTSGPLSVQNIFDFLSAWFAGGC
jgi:hypothetical protein